MKKFWIIILLIALSWACGREKPQMKFPDGKKIVGLASPVKLELGSTAIYLGDYFPHPELIDSVYIAGTKIKLAADKSVFYFREPREAGPLMEMMVWIKGDIYSILVEKAKKKEFNFSFDPKGKNYSKVEIAAEFNGWTPARNQLKLKDGKWQGVLYLDPGRYQYQIAADDKWFLDPANKDSVDNNNGGYNSVLKVGLEEQKKSPFLFTESFDKYVVRIGSRNTPLEYFVYWQNFRLPGIFQKTDKNSLEIFIPGQAKDMDRSYIRVFAYNASGISNDIFIPLDHGRVMDDPGELKRSDEHAFIMYNVFVDRFFDGDSSNDEPLNSPEVLPAADFHGGDISGITDKINDGYFQKLGVNTIWMSPVVLNPKGAFGLWKNPKTKFSAYHGYWPISFTQIDPRFGNSSEMKQLVSTSHKDGLNVLLDFVAHHVHEQHPVYKEHPDWTTNLYLPDGTLNTEKWDEYRLTTWFDVFLPTLNTGLPQVREMLSDSAVWWIKTYDLDGFRHDATKHIPESFWRTLTRKLKLDVDIPENRYVFQIGETYGGPQLISSYVGSGMLDGQFDFNVYDAAVGVFARDKDPFSNLDNTLHQSFDYYGSHNLMGYITGNQDRARFISYAGGDLRFDEDAKAAGWQRKVGVGDPVGYKKLSMLTAFNMTIPGIPVIYYGDEIGMPGGNDPDSRRMMRFENLSEKETQTLNTAEKLIQLRKDNLSLIYGDFMTLLVTHDQYVFMRKYFGEISIILFNKSAKEIHLEVPLPGNMKIKGLKANFGNEPGLSGNKLEIDLPPDSFEILNGNI